MYHSVLPLAVPPVSAVPTDSNRGPCYACVFPPTVVAEATTAEDGLSIELAEEKAALMGTGACSDEGVLGILCGIVGLVMGSEALRVLLGIGKSLTGSPSVRRLIFASSQLHQHYIYCPHSPNRLVEPSNSELDH